ncbi:MAG: FtsX-like permease family protein [Planctomycetota bacterium]|jgi:ABC-type antimicrobial peptide transport system permease subunit
MMRTEFPLRFLFRNAGRRKGRFLLGALGVFVGVTLLTAIQVGMDSLSLAYIDFATIAAGKADALVMPQNANIFEPRFFDGKAKDAKAIIAGVEGVGGVADGVLWGAQSVLEKTAEGEVLSFHPKGDSVFLVEEGRSGADAGDPWTKRLKEEGCLISSALAEALAAGPGDEVRVGGDEERSWIVRAVVKSPSEESEDHFIVFDPRIASDFAGTERIPLRHAGTVFTAIVGMDIPAQEALDLGTFLVKKDPDGEGDGRPWVERIGEGRCLISETLADRIGAEPGDSLEISGFRAPLGLSEPRAFEVRAVVKQRGVFPDFLRGFCVLDPEEAAALAGWPGDVNFLAVSFSDRRKVYDARDIHRSVLRAREIGERVQEALGLDYTVSMPKCVVLDLRESITSLLRGIFSLFGVVAVAISALLIYSLLSISVEERVRENAILRTLGAKRRFIIGTVVGEGVLLCVAGAFFGVLGGIGLTWLGTVIGSAAAEAEGFPLEVGLFIRPSSLAAAFFGGVFIALLSSIFPARRSVRASIVEALNAYRAPPSPIKLIRERGLDTRLVAAGLVITLFMGFFTILIPRTLASGDATLIAVVLGTVLIALLVGMVLLSLGGQPVLERLLFFLFRKPLARSADLVERNLKRYRRRNTATSLIFSLSVALVLFVASMAAILFEQAGRVARFLNGADIRVETWYKPRLDLKKELGQTEGVDRVVEVLVGSMMRSRDMVDWRIRVVTSDLVEVRRTRVRLYGAGPELLDAVFHEDLRFHDGDASAFQTLKGDPGEEEPGAVILPLSIASALSVKAGSLIKLRSRVGPHRAYRLARVEAVLDKFPGFPDFFSGKMRAWGAGILVSREMFEGLLGKGPPPGEEGPNPEDGLPSLAGASGLQWRTIYFVKKKKGAGPVGKRIREKWGWGRMGTAIRDTEEDVQNARNLYYSTQVLFTGILALSVTIALFGLLASMYTTVLERKREIVILKALGMRRRDLLRMFSGETTILLLTSGTLGALTGYVLAYLLISQQTVISELPTPFTVPLIPILGMILISIAMGLFGAWLPTRRLVKKSPAEIIREG